MAINIKNPEACRLIKELSAATGETLTDAVVTAARERLERLKHRDGGSLADRLLAIGRDCAAHLGSDFSSIDHDALLYDEKGLPR